MSSYRTLPLDVIKDPTVSLRPVDKNTEDYLSLVESIRERGVLQPIVVREVGIEFVLVAGRHRLYAARDAGLTEIGAMVHEAMDDVEAMTAQVIENVHRAETKPVEYAHMIQRIMKARPGLMMKDLAKMLGKTTSWISGILSLLNLAEKVQPLVESGQINVANAVALAKLTPRDQTDMVDRARTTPTVEFSGIVNQMVRERRDHAYEGKRSKDPITDYESVPYLQKLSDLKAEMADGRIADILLAKTGITDTREAFKLALKWALHLDPISIAAKRKTDEEYRAKVEARRQALAEERANRGS